MRGNRMMYKIAVVEEVTKIVTSDQGAQETEYHNHSEGVELTVF